MNDGIEQPPVPPGGGEVVAPHAHVAVCDLLGPEQQPLLGCHVLGLARDMDVRDLSTGETQHTPQMQHKTCYLVAALQDGGQLRTLNATLGIRRPSAAAQLDFNARQWQESVSGAVFKIFSQKIFIDFKGMSSSISSEPSAIEGQVKSLEVQRKPPCFKIIYMTNVTQQNIVQ